MGLSHPPGIHEGYDGMIEIKPHPSKRPDGSQVFPDQRAVYVQGRLTAYVTGKNAILFHLHSEPSLVEEIKAVVRQELGEPERVVMIAEPDPELYDDQE